MVFRVLGPVEAQVGGDWRSPGPPKQRAVLALLLLHGNRPVSIASLLETLWGDGPPRTAVKNIQVYVWQLRKLCGSRLQSRPPGYRLALAPGELDAADFEVRVTEAREARRRGDLEEASEHFAAALALWHGPALADLDAVGPLAAWAHRLDAERLRAVHEWIDVELALGRHDALVPRLAELAVEHPLDERLRERQMLALHRAGRPAEALAAYASAEAVLSAELGEQPGAELQAAARAVRRALAPPDAARAGGSVVRQLPMTAASFTGRRSEITRLCDLITPQVVSVPVVVVTGPGGVGKSTLAIRVAHQLDDTFFDGQLYLDLLGATAGLESMLAGEALRRLLRSLGVDDADVPADAGEAAALFRSRTAGRRLLVVLDNAADSGQVRHLLPATGGCAVLVTSRWPLTDIDGAVHLHLDMLLTAEAVELFRRVAGPEPIADEPGEVLSIVDACAGLPLALRLAGARLAARPSWTVRTLAERLRDERRRLDELRAGDVAVRTSFLVSYRALPAGARLVFRRSGLFPGPDFAPEPIAVLADCTSSAAEALLEVLVDASLLQTTGSSRYRLHDLIRIYAAECALHEDGAAACDDAFGRLADWYLHAADLADRLLMPVRGRITIGPAGPQPAPFAPAGRVEAFEWYEAERANLGAVIRAAARRGHHRVAWQLPVTMRGFLELRRYTDDWVAIHRVGLESARSIGDREGEGWILNGLGTGYWRQERYADAIDCYRQALAVRDALDDRRGVAVVLNNLGSVYHEAGDPDAAIECLREALVIRRAIGAQHDESFALHNLGHVYHQCGRFGEAMPLLDRALHIRRELGNRNGEGITLHCLADTLLGLGRHADSAQHLEHALGIFREAGNRYGEAAALHSLGRVRIAQQLADDAASHLREAMSIYHELGNRRDEATAHRDLQDAQRAARA